MIPEKTRPHLLTALGGVGLLVLSACSTSAPYGARYDDGYTYSHRQHGLYNDAGYRAQRWRDDDDRYHDRRAPVVYTYRAPAPYTYYVYDEDGYRRYAYRPSGARYYYDDMRYGYRAPVYDGDGYRWYGSRQPSYRYYHEGYGGNRRD
jgi:hypothetical protein